MTLQRIKYSVGIAWRMSILIVALPVLFVCIAIMSVLIHAKMFVCLITPEPREAIYYEEREDADDDTI